MIYKKGTLVLLGLHYYHDYRTVGVVVEYLGGSDLYQVRRSIGSQIISPHEIIYAYPPDMFDNPKEALEWWEVCIRVNGGPYITYTQGIAAPSVILNNIPGVEGPITINR